MSRSSSKLLSHEFSRCLLGLNFQTFYTCQKFQKLLAQSKGKTAEDFDSI
jgi:hypothetical protein